MKIVYLSVILGLCLPVFAQFPAPYCSEQMQLGVLPITRVTFGTIHNLSPLTPAGPAHEDFTALSTGLLGGQPYTITLEGTTNGSAPDRYYVFADWNRDGDFFDPGEGQFIGNIANSTGVDGTILSGVIIPPVDATPGTSRLRVAKRSNMNFNPCNTLGIGQAEDYTIVISIPPPMAFYVKESAPGSDNTGFSWTNAFTDLSLALATARMGDTIKVASGNYFPGIPLTRTFELKEGVLMLGGYPSSGNPGDADRDFNLNPVVLNGNNGSWHSFHVVSGYDLTAATVIDGFAIAGGDAHNTPSGNFEKGGGLILQNSHPVFKNCVFRDNEAPHGGAAAFFASNPSFTKCVFKNNHAFLGGAATYSEDSEPTFSSCVFIDNGMETGTHSTMINTLNSNVRITNSVFTKNKGRIIHNDQSTVSIQFSSLVNNRLDYYIERSEPSILGVNSSTINIENSILYFNNLVRGKDTADIYVENSVANVSNSFTHAYFNGNTTMKYADPRFRDTSDIDGPDDLFFTADDGLQLMNPCSPAINAGTLPGSAVPTDILGNPRVYGALPDIGAYELQEAVLPVPRVAYVNKLATGNNDGSSWVNAFTELRTAIQYCSDTIKVAAGIYHPSDSDPWAVFWLENNRVILGGYPASGNPADAQRDPAANLTVLSGNLPASSGELSYSLMRGRFINNTSIVDGLILQQTDGEGSYNSMSLVGGAINLTSGATPVFRNCVIKDNFSRVGGALTTHNGSNAHFINCTIENNLPSPNTDYGNAVVNFNSSPVFIKCIFTKNKTSVSSTINRHGAAMLNFNSSPVIDSCVFSYNDARDYGGAIANQDNSNPVISNSLFHANYAREGACDIYNVNSSPVITNTMFFDSLRTRYGGSIANIENSNPIFTKCTFYNGRANDGGAVFNDRSFATFNYCAFYRGNADNGGAIASRNYSKVYLNNCIGVLNSGTGSVLHNRKSEVRIVNSTFAMNDSEIIINTDSTNLHVQNSIFSNNKVTELGHPAEIGDGSPAHQPSNITVENSLLEGYGINGISGNIVGHTARLKNHEDPLGPDGVFFTADDGIQLSRCSPAINAGSNTLASGLTTDLTGNSRVFNNIVDIGAYEFLGSVSGSGVIYVNKSASGNNDGTSWQNAFTDLTNALNISCTDTIKIAAGTYYPVAVRDSSFRFNKAKVVWGGYPSSGNPGDAQRDHELWPTILSGDIGTAGDSLDNNYHVVVVNQPDTTVQIDGITIEKGNANGTTIFPNPYQYYRVLIPQQLGAGIFHRNGKVVLTNCVIRENTNGSAYYNDLGLIEFNRNVFSANSANAAGGAYNSAGTLPRNTVIVNSVFVNNTSGQYAGALNLAGTGTSDTTQLRNNLFLGNKSMYQGGAIYMKNSPRISLVNNTFAYNAIYGPGTHPLRQGGAIYVDGTWNSPVYNNIFYKNEYLTTTGLGADIYNNSCPTYSSCTNYSLRRNILQVFGTDPFLQNIYTSPLFANEADADGPDNKWFTNDDGYQLLFNSPGIDHGDNPSIAGYTLDLAGNPRINNNTVDLGAYEYTDIPVAFAGPDTLICEGNSVQLGITGNPSHSYNWTSSPAGFTSADASPLATPLISTSYFLEVSNGTITARDTVMVTVTPLLTPSVLVSSSAINICPGTSVTFTADPVNGGLNPSFQWQVNGVSEGTDSAIFITSALSNNDQVTVIMTSNFSCLTNPAATSAPVVISVGTVSPTATITSTSSDICSGTSVTFTATPVNGGTFPVWQWLVNDIVSGTNDPVFSTSALSNGSEVKVVMTSNDACALPLMDTSNIITVTVTPTVGPAITITSSATTICAGETIAFEATPSNGGPTPVFQWMVNGVNAGTNSQYFNSSTLTNGDMITVGLTSSSPCASPATIISAPIAITVNPSVTPVATISGQTSVVQGISTLISATVTGAGSSPLYQWQDSTLLQNWQNIAGAVSTDINYIPAASGDKIRCMVTGNEACASTNMVTSNVLTFTVETLVPRINVYPVPATTSVTVDNLDTGEAWYALSIMGMGGSQDIIRQNIQGRNRVTINISSLPAGVYIIKISKEAGEPTYLRFIKQ